MLAKYSLGFLIASLVQIGILYISEIFNISRLGMQYPLLHILLDIVVGQIAGYILFFSIQNRIDTNRFMTGVIWGIIVWAAMTSLGIAFEKITMPWHQKLSSLIIGVVSFIVYGIITTYFITIFDKEKASA